MQRSHCWILDRAIKAEGEKKKKREECGERGAGRKEQWDRRIKDKSPP